MHAPLRRALVAVLLAAPLAGWAQVVPTTPTKFTTRATGICAAAPADTAAAPAVRPRPSPAIAMQKRVASAFAPAGQARAAADEDWTEF